MLHRGVAAAWTAVGQWIAEPVWSREPVLTLTFSADRPELLAPFDSLGILLRGDEVDGFAFNGVVDLNRGM